MSISTSELLDWVESTEFDAEMSALSSYRSFLAALVSDATVLELLHQLRGSSSLQIRVLERLQAFVDAEKTAGQARFADVPIATYLYVLGETTPQKARKLAQQVALLPTLWWSQQLADEQLETLT